MEFLSVIFLFISATFSALASVVIKYQDRIYILNNLGDSIISKTPALFFYGIGFVFYSMALKHSLVSKAYPLMVAFAVLQLLFFGFLFGEQISAKLIIGIVVILCGIIIINV
ncbi:hypothetical protein ACXNAL_19880 [Kluyvera ascorbata]|uniref:EamA family transporter n=1 Tax=Kluyvera ascorbata TaxID=51288 RepID=UPI0018A51927|nr:EamA family transporter [Kluyvera ascorbata]BBV68049.1 hypothetical protein STW0522KLE44_44370 [Klebsiella sp. STW0522-44]MDU3910993.1 hypothetical protein [Kluyvera ascorbata]HAT7514757.1 hypothetical protein [Kluyvera ascorbata]HCL5621754.1 hypothetical protein [Kluyvera ascorbata]HDG1663271.1 hypothetical protein [Kluyvera ascorbata]